MIRCGKVLFFSLGGSEEEYVKEFLYWEIRYDNNSMIDLKTVDPRPGARETQIRLWGHPTNMTEYQKAYRGYRYIDVQQKGKHFLRAYGTKKELF